MTDTEGADASAQTSAKRHRRPGDGALTTGVIVIALGIIGVVLGLDSAVDERVNGDSGYFAEEFDYLSAVGYLTLGSALLIVGLLVAIVGYLHRIYEEQRQ